MILDFKPAHQTDLSLAYSFLRDSFQISFGRDSSLWPNNLGNLTEHDYIEIIQKKLVRDAEAVIHVWQNDEIIGQIESSVKKNDSKCGYVSLYYLIPEKRGAGLGLLMDKYVRLRLSRLGCIRAELTVVTSNSPALKFYQKQGWINKGPHPLYQDGILMEKIFD